MGEIAQLGILQKLPDHEVRKLKILEGLVGFIKAKGTSITNRNMEIIVRGMTKNRTQATVVLTVIFRQNQRSNRIHSPILEQLI